MTNAEYLIAIDKRRSRRAFKPKPLDDDVKQLIKELVAYVNEKAGLILFLLTMHALPSMCSPE